MYSFLLLLKIDRLTHLYRPEAVLLRLIQLGRPPLPECSILSLLRPEVRSNDPLAGAGQGFEDLRLLFVYHHAGPRPAGGDVLGLWERERSFALG
jgi:hypothetical protein